MPLPSSPARCSIPTGAKSLTVKGESEARPSLLLYKGIAPIEAAAAPSILLPVIAAHATLALSRTACFLVAHLWRMRLC